MTFKKTATILLLTAAVVGPAFAKKDKSKDKAETAPAVAAPAAAPADAADARPAATVGGAVITIRPAPGMPSTRRCWQIRPVHCP